MGIEELPYQAYQKLLAAQATVDISTRLELLKEARQMYLRCLEVDINDVKRELCEHILIQINEYLKLGDLLDITEN